MMAVLALARSLKKYKTIILSSKDSDNVVLAYPFADALAESGEVVLVRCRLARAGARWRALPAGALLLMPPPPPRRPRCCRWPGTSGSAPASAWRCSTATSSGAASSSRAASPASCRCSW
jgi:hypothetical protein